MLHAIAAAIALALVIGLLKLSDYRTARDGAWHSDGARMFLWDGERYIYREMTQDEANAESDLRSW